MAACDKLYGTREQWKELYIYIEKNKPEYLHYMREEEPGSEGDQWTLCYARGMQEWLYDEFPGSWVKEKLDENIYTQKMIGSF